MYKSKRCYMVYRVLVSVGSIQTNLVNQCYEHKKHFILIFFSDMFRLLAIIKDCTKPSWPAPKACSVYSFIY